MKPNYNQHEHNQSRSGAPSLEALFRWLEKSLMSEDRELFRHPFKSAPRRPSEIIHQLEQKFMSKRKSKTKAEGQSALESIPEFWRGLILRKDAFPDEADYYASIRSMCIVHEVISLILRPYIVASLSATKVRGKMLEFEMNLSSDLPEAENGKREDCPLIDLTQDSTPSLDPTANFQTLLIQMRTWSNDRAIMRTILLAAQLNRYAGHAPLQRWLEKPNPILAGQSPLENIAQGNWPAVAELIDDLLTGSQGF